MFIKNVRFGIFCNDNGQGLALIDMARGTRWSLDERTLVYGDQKDPLAPVRACADSGTVMVEYLAGGVRMRYLYTLRDDFVEVRLPATERDEIGCAVLPGSFLPCGEKGKFLLPVMQGILWDGRGEPFEWELKEAGHVGFTMPFIGIMGESGGLLFTAETRDDVRWWIGKDESGRCWAANLQISSLGSLRYERVGRITFTDPDITAVAKAYRRKVVGQGMFRSWEDKIAERPGLERLFGSLMCYIGYCRDDIDYVAECRKLKEYGFDRAFLYPGRFNAYDPHIHMGGLPIIDMPERDVMAIRGMGYDMAPWSWINEAMDDGKADTRHMFKKDRSGNVLFNWAIDDQVWYLVCSTFFEEFQKNAVKTSIKDMTWDHFDVLACATVGECYALDHPNHQGRPISRSEDREWIKKAFLASKNAGLAVSSENFNDAYSMEADFGSVKALPQYGTAPFWPVPLTMLVYHDSMIHSWYELHSYNNHWRGGIPNGIVYGGGYPREMAAMDALMGCPPDVFPFGAQYGYNGNGKDTFLYRYRFEDPEVQIALRKALPVARLHRKIGKQEMVHFKILSEDGYVQESAFADGTRVVANFHPCVCSGKKGFCCKDVPGAESLMPASWKAM